MHVLTQIHATKNGSTAEVKELLEEGEDPNSYNNNKVVMSNSDNTVTCMFMSAP